jgi:putative transposase
MTKQPYKSSSHAVYLLRLHFVFVTKYRHPVITPDIETELREAFDAIAKGWNAEVVECGVEPNHAHVLIDIIPATDISRLANNLKSASSKRVRNKFSSWVEQFYWKPYFWHRGYFVTSVGNATLDMVKKYIETQSTYGKDSRLDPPPKP